MNKPTKFNPQIHHRKSMRLPGYDYGQEGLYFLTFCCQGRAHVFGEIVNGEMVLNEYGLIAQNEWLKTPEVRPNIELDVFVIMPNHIHAIVVIAHRVETNIPTDNGKGELNSPVNTGRIQSAPTDNGKGELNSPVNTGQIQSGPTGTSNTIGAIVRGYKSSVTKQLGLLGFDGKVWQRNYHDHIIRNEQAFQNISNYIINNPARWDEDKFHT